MDRLYNERLEFLKSHTILGPVALIKLSTLKENMERARMLYYKLEGSMPDFDFDSLDQYEYDLRFANWEFQCMDQWLIRPDDRSLREFAEIAMDQKMARDKFYSRKKVRK